MDAVVGPAADGQKLAEIRFRRGENDDPFARRFGPEQPPAESFVSPAPVGKTLDMIFLFRRKPKTTRNAGADGDRLYYGVADLSIRDENGRILGASVVKSLALGFGVRLAIREEAVRSAKELHVSLKMVSSVADLRLIADFYREKERWYLRERPDYAEALDP